MIKLALTFLPSFPKNDHSFARIKPIVVDILYDVFNKRCFNIWCVGDNVRRTFLLMHGVSQKALDNFE